MTTPLEFILEKKIIAIIRGVSPPDIISVVDALYEGGISIVEITLNSEDALRQIGLVADKFSGKMLVGAGTVLERDEVRAAKDAGARFIISPGFDENVVAATRFEGLVSIPGAYTPTEVMRAHREGADIVKIFPVSNPEYIRNITAPLNRIRMMPTGGIGPFNIKEFKASGAIAFGIGSALVSKVAKADENYLSGIREKAAALLSALAAS